jgi:hypothetical protein
VGIVLLKVGGEACFKIQYHQKKKKKKSSEETDA